MSNTEVLDIMYQAFQLAMKLSLPFLLVSMIVGVVIAVFQAATQINEQTMTFVPKLLAILALNGNTWKLHAGDAAGIYVPDR